VILLSGMFLMGQGSECPWAEGVNISKIFPDYALAVSIRVWIGKPPPICLSDLEGLTAFGNKTYMTIYDLTGLEYCTGLIHLWTDGNQISDLGPLAGLINLEYINLMSNQISDLGPLAGLINLEYINLEGNQISDLGPLAGLTNLSGLYLSDNEITDISPLAGMTDLVSLYLDNNQISDLGPLAELTNLESLNLWANQITDISPLAGLTNLNLLYLESNQISDIYPLVQNPGIGSGDRVYLNNNPLDDTSCTVYLPQLQSRGVYVGHDCP
jgi:Leucine-rich repeat (LRR) protein